MVCLHEQIRDSDHGPKFCKRMNDINKATFPDSQVRSALASSDVQ